MYWLTGILGLIMIVAPYVLGFSGDPGALWTNIILGAVVFLASGYKAIGRLRLNNPSCLQALLPVSRWAKWRCCRIVPGGMLKQTNRL
ncbi:MAG: SPW repeat protein [Chloroflexota bacterium]